MGTPYRSIFPCPTLALDPGRIPIANASYPAGLSAFPPDALPHNLSPRPPIEKVLFKISPLNRGLGYPSSYIDLARPASDDTPLDVGHRSSFLVESPCKNSGATRGTTCVPPSRTPLTRCASTRADDIWWFKTVFIAAFYLS